MYKELERTKFVELLAEYTQRSKTDTLNRLVEQTAAVLSVGGGVGLYVYVSQPGRPKVPVTRDYYRIGYTRAAPLPRRRTIDREHFHHLYTGVEDQTTFLAAHYQGEPVTPGEVISAAIEHASELRDETIREFWFLDAFGPLPPGEIFERGLNKLDACRYTNYLYGPAHRILRATQCRHKYYLTDSCPGCDADEENRTGPWEGVTELGYV